MTAVIEDDTASRGRISFAGDEVCMSRAMAEQLRDFLVKHYTIISSNRKLSLSLKEKEEMLDELRRWQNVMLGRESRIIELKYEVNELLARTGLPPRYTEEV
jgi:hypothetical protein